MMNSASIATGTYPGAHGFYGNVVYAPKARGKNAKGVEIDFSAPAFIEDFGVVEAVRESYQGNLTLVSTMLQAAQTKGLTTAAIGKFGAAFIRITSVGASSVVKPDNAKPRRASKAVFALPRNTIQCDAGALVLAVTTVTAAQSLFKNLTGQTRSARPHWSPPRRGFAILLTYSSITFSRIRSWTCDLLVEGTGCHESRVGRTYNSIDATKMNDEILGKVVDKIRQLGWEQATDIIITQDHNHSTVSGNVADYPLRGIVGNGVGSYDPQGYSVSGFVRTAELLTRDGLKAYDGAGCRDIPTLSGILI
jgi:hypothetical protein